MSIENEYRHRELIGATVESVTLDGGLVYLTLPTATVLVRAPETIWYEDSRCEACDHFNPAGSLGDPCEHGI